VQLGRQFDGACALVAAVCARGAVQTADSAAEPVRLRERALLMTGSITIASRRSPGAEAEAAASAFRRCIVP
jgi:hypothetical protein